MNPVGVPGGIGYRGGMNKPLASGHSISGTSASARIHADLRQRIIGFDLPPDTTLDRSELAAHYEVSQSPIREAMMRLEQDGLVASYPQSRTVVTRIDRTRIVQEHFLRVAVECEVVRRLTENPRPEAISRLRGYLRLQEAIVEDLDQAALFKQLDDAFHEALFEAAEQGGLHAHIASQSSQMARLRTLDLPRKGKMSAVFEGHKQVIDAIEAGDANGAADAMRAHLSGTIDRIPALVAEYPRYFS